MPHPLYLLLRTLLFALPAEAAHHLGIAVLRLVGRVRELCEVVRARVIRGTEVVRIRSGTASGPARAPRLHLVDLSARMGRLRLAHPIALAAGLDKDARAIHGLFALGFSALEVGTVTPRPQSGNPKPRLFRLPEQKALINRMGFNNRGMDEMARSLSQQSWRPGPVGINLGKNKDTPLGSAVDDYLACVDKLAPMADYLVLNTSSPNTPGLRTLQEPDQLNELLSAVRKRVDRVAPRKSLFLKFAPDLAPEAIDALVDIAIDHRLDGLIATNTTVTRPLKHRLEHEAGGLSGAPLFSLSTEALRRAYSRAAGRLDLWGVGGVFTAEDAYRKIRAGAMAVQVYTGLVYSGPAVVRELLKGLGKLLARDGFARLEEAVGADSRGP
jgi:dihydroorotate dehydrogenase